MYILALILFYILLRWMSPYTIMSLANLAIPPNTDTFLPLSDFTDIPSTNFESNWREIAAEYRNLLTQGTAPEFKAIDPSQHGVANGMWRVLFLRATGVDCPNAKHCPLTMSIINSCPGVSTAFFSTLEPGTVLEPHEGPQQGVLRYHLGLEVPEPELCSLTVGGETRHWKEGESLLWNDTVTHSAENRGTKNRVILFLDVERPLPWIFKCVLRLSHALVRMNPSYQKLIMASEPAPTKA
jgi:aspartyl/asparaginyl beta-hydroxylase (cupin superfamily)